VASHQLSHPLWQSQIDPEQTGHGLDWWQLTSRHIQACSTTPARLKIPCDCSLPPQDLPPTQQHQDTSFSLLTCGLGVVLWSFLSMLTMPAFSICSKTGTVWLLGPKEATSLVAEGKVQPHQQIHTGHQQQHQPMCSCRGCVQHRKVRAGLLPLIWNIDVCWLTGGCIGQSHDGIQANENLLFCSSHSVVGTTTTFLS
jgi:hypothetical protein